MSRMGSLLSLVIPVYNEADSLVPLVAEIDEALAAYGTPYEIVFVDDGSTDGSFPVMKELAEARDDVRVVKLRRNFGKAAALSHGFAAARGDSTPTPSSPSGGSPDRRAHRPAVRDRARTSSRRWPRTTRWSRAHGALQDARGRAHEDRQRRALAGLRPALRASASCAIPENEPGSSIMPGKVNPTQCEALDDGLRPR